MSFSLQDLFMMQTEQVTDRQLSWRDEEIFLSAAVESLRYVREVLQETVHTQIHTVLLASECDLPSEVRFQGYNQFAV